MLVSADQRRVGEIGLVDPKTGDAMPVEAIAGKILSNHGELTAVVTILHDRREAIEKAKLYEQLKQGSDELERKIQAATGDIAQIEAGRMPLQITTFKVPELVAEVRAELEPIILRSNLTVRVDLARDLGRISTDRQKVKQILLNLLSNALKFTHEGSVTISAR